MSQSAGAIAIIWHRVCVDVINYERLVGQQGALRSAVASPGIGILTERTPFGGKVGHFDVEGYPLPISARFCDHSAFYRPSRRWKELLPGEPHSVGHTAGIVVHYCGIAFYL